jgi:hypothetical protein
MIRFGPISWKNSVIMHRQLRNMETQPKPSWLKEEQSKFEPGVCLHLLIQRLWSWCSLNRKLCVMLIVPSEVKVTHNGRCLSISLWEEIYQNHIKYGSNVKVKLFLRDGFNKISLNMKVVCEDTFEVIWTLFITES